MNADDLRALLPPRPQPSALPHQAQRRAGLLAILAVQPQRAAPGWRGWPSPRRWLIPLAAAAAVTAVVLAAAMLPPFGTQPIGRNHPTQAGSRPTAPFDGTGSLPTVRHWQVSATGLSRVVVHTNAGPVNVAAQLVSAKPSTGAHGEGLASVNVGASPSYRGTAPVVSSTVSQGTLLISVRCLPASGPNCRVTLTMTLPHALPLQVSSQLGDVIVTGMTASVSVSDALGDIQLDNLAGPVTARSTGGDIRGVGLTSNQVTLTDGLGDINVNFAAPPVLVNATNQEGDVTLQVPGTASYKVAAHSGLGSSSVTVPRSAATAHVIDATSQLGDVTITD